MKFISALSKTKQLHEISLEERLVVNKVVSEWLAYGYSTLPIDMDACKLALGKLYALNNLPPPNMTLYASPNDFFQRANFEIRGKQLYSPDGAGAPLNCCSKFNNLEFMGDDMVWATWLDLDGKLDFFGDVFSTIMESVKEFSVAHCVLNLSPGIFVYGDTFAIYDALIQLGHFPQDDEFCSIKEAVISAGFIVPYTNHCYLISRPTQINYSENREGESSISIKFSDGLILPS